MSSAGKVIWLASTQKIQNRMKQTNRKEYYLCRGMISQAILVHRFARDPHKCLFHASMPSVVVCPGNVFSQWLGWAWAGGCASQLKQLALQPGRILLLSASKLLQAMLCYRLALYIYTAVHFDLLFQGSS